LRPAAAEANSAEPRRAGFMMRETKHPRPDPQEGA
jgi:hypothetical protein